MKPIIVFIGFLLLTLAGCGGAPGNSNTPPTAIDNTNTAPTDTQFSAITDANTALAEGKRLLDENQTEMAISALKRAVEIDPDMAEAHFHLGIAYALLEMQLEQSGQVAETVSNSNSKDKVKKTRSELAFEDAIKAYKKWIDKNPKDDVAHYYMGRTYAKLMNDDDAEKAFQEAVKLKPDDTEYQTELGGILIKLAQYHEAIKPLKKAIELDQANGRAIDLLEDAEAGRRRVDYVSANKNANTPVGKGNTNSNANLASNTSLPANAATKHPEANTKPKKPEPEVKPKKSDPKDGRPRKIPNQN